MSLGMKVVGADRESGIGSTLSLIKVITNEVYLISQIVLVA